MAGLALRFENFTRVLDNEMLAEMTEATEGDKEIQMASITLEKQNRSEKLYSLLSMLIRIDHRGW